MTGEVINKYAAEWIEGANHFTGGKPNAGASGPPTNKRDFLIENKRINLAQSAITE